MNILCRQNMYCYIPEYNVLFNSKELFGTTECLPLCSRVAKTYLVLTGLDVYIYIRTVEPRYNDIYLDNNLPKL